MYRTVLKTVKTIEQKFSPLEKQFEQQFHAIWGPFKDRLNNMYHDGGDADSEEKEREELRKIMTQALAATGFEAGLQATVDRMQPLQLGLFKKQDDFDRGYIHICWNLIGEVRKAVFNAIDFLGLELWRRYILKGLDALVDELRIDKVPLRNPTPSPFRSLARKRSARSGSERGAHPLSRWPHRGSGLLQTQGKHVHLVSHGTR